MLDIHNFIPNSIFYCFFFHRYRNKCPRQWLDLMTTFEKAKKEAKPGERPISINLSWEMGSQYSSITGKQVDRVIRQSGGSYGVRFDNGLIIIHNDAVKKMFDPVTDEVVKHVRNLLAHSKVSGCEYFFLVGGFGESAFLQNAIKSAFSSVKVLVPTEAQMAVIKGAVLYGHKPSEIQSRISRLTYGCMIVEPFDPQKHDESKKVGPYCKDIFHVFVEKDEEVQLDQEKTYTFYPTNPFSTEVEMNLFSIDRKPNKVKYTTDLDVKKLGDGITIQMPNTKGGGSREIETIIKFGGTEIKVEAKDKTSGNIAKTTVSFVSG